MYDLANFIMFIALGLLGGAMGQIIRQIGSVKKLMDQYPNEPIKNHFDGTRFFINVCLGASAGVLGALTLMPESGKMSTTDFVKTFTSLIGFGYAGADFVESFMHKSYGSNSPTSITPSQQP